jgi:hypothetical protein
MASETQTSNAVLMVRPAAFGFHAEAAASNAFANSPGHAEVAQQAIAEFDELVERLRSAGVDAITLEDTPEPAKPDAVFPNNWVSFHADGTMVLYPMATAARRIERAADRLRVLLDRAGFQVARTVDLSVHERDGRALEGPGSLVLDRPRRRAYASLSPRTDASVIGEFDRQLGFSTAVFDARDRSGRPIYHTNVLMSLGGEFAILCTEAVSPEHRRPLIEDIEASGRALIEVDFGQLRQFACNAIELRGRDGPVIAMSSAARASFMPGQLRSLEGFGQIVDAPIPTIEAVGGGSVRCMIADLHLPRR